MVRERIGRRGASGLPASVATAGDAIKWLKTRGEGYARAFEREDIIRTAIDQTHASHGVFVQGAREIAFFPPITGG